MALSNTHLTAVRVSTIVLLTMFLLPVFGQDEQNETKQDSTSRFNLGFEYYQKEDYEAALVWFKLAAEQGFANAQYNLGVMYDQGQGVAQDYKEAVRWYRKAAEQGHACSQFILGSMYDNGQGVPQDYVQAHMWYNLAASQLTGEDRERSVKNRDIVAEKMTSEQIAEAQRLAREWKPQSSESQ